MIESPRGEIAAINEFDLSQMTCSFPSALTRDVGNAPALAERTHEQRVDAAKTDQTVDRSSCVTRTGSPPVGATFQTSPIFVSRSETK